MQWNVLASTKADDFIINSSEDGCLDWAFRSRRIADIIREKNPDIVTLQEADKPEDIICWLTGWSYVELDKEEVVVLYKPARFLMLNYNRITRKTLSVQLYDKDNDKTITVVSSHFKSGRSINSEKKRQEQFEQLKKHLDFVNSWIMGADINCDENYTATDLSFNEILSNYCSVYKPDVSTFKIRSLNSPQVDKRGELANWSIDRIAWTSEYNFTPTTNYTRQEIDFDVKEVVEVNKLEYSDILNLNVLPTRENPSDHFPLVGTFTY